MQFKELKPNYSVYVLDKTELTCKEAKVTSVSPPRFDNKVGQTPCMIVDITLDMDGKNTTFVFPDGSSKAYSGNLTFCIDKNDVIADVRLIQRASKQILDDVPKHEETVRKCEALLGELDTEEKAKQEMENRLRNMESRFDNIENLLKKIANK